MATKNTALRNLLADALGNVLDSATLKIYTTGQGTLLVTFTFSGTAFPAASNGVITLAGVPYSVAAAGTGTAAEAELASTGSTYVVTGLTVGTSSAHVIIDNTSINAGQTVNLTAFTWTEASTIAAP